MSDILIPISSGNRNVKRPACEKTLYLDPTLNVYLSFLQKKKRTKNKQSGRQETVLKNLSRKKLTLGNASHIGLFKLSMVFTSGGFLSIHVKGFLLTTFSV